MPLHSGDAKIGDSQFMLDEKGLTSYGNVAAGFVGKEGAIGESVNVTSIPCFHMHGIRNSRCVTHFYVVD